MTSTERVIEYTNLEPEADWSSGDGRPPPSDWPQEGAVQFDGVNLQYSKEGPLVLKNISMKIAPREKVSGQQDVKQEEKEKLEDIFKEDLIVNQLLPRFGKIKGFHRPLSSAGFYLNT